MGISAVGGYIVGVFAFGGYVLNVVGISAVGGENILLKAGFRRASRGCR